MRDLNVFTLADRAAHRRPLPPCEQDEPVVARCLTCRPHESHAPGECPAGLYDRDGLPAPCRCIGVDNSEYEDQP